MGARLVVGRVCRAHGVRGDVTVELYTDSPELRFAEGSRLDRDPPEAGSLAVASGRPYKNGWLVHFTGIDGRDAAEALCGALLLADADTGVAGEGAWWDHELVGLTAVSVDESVIGTVEAVRHAPAGVLLIVRHGDGREILVPFVHAIVPEVDVHSRRLVVDPPDGLLDLE